MLKFERSWKNVNHANDPWKEIDEDRVNRDLANQYGENAVEKLKEKKTLETRFGCYRVVEE